MRAFHLIRVLGRIPKQRRFAAGVLLLPAVLFTLLALLSTPAFSQSANQRLILKDGSYQVITQYKIVGNRVRFYSAERAEWEEIPKDLVNWPATTKWNKDHGLGPVNSGPASPEAAALDQQEQQQRTETPEVAPGLTLPDQQGVWALDTFHGHPELVRLVQDSGDVNQQTGHNIDRQSLSGKGELKKRIEMDGARSKVQLHVSQPPLYVSLTVPHESAGQGAFTVNVQDANPVNPKNSVSSPKSQYIIVKVFSNYRHNYRVVSQIHLPKNGRITATADVIPTVQKILPGGNWMKLTPSHPLRIGEYALMEILRPGKINAAVWDFRIDPRGPENRNAIRPLNETLNEP